MFIYDIHSRMITTNQQLIEAIRNSDNLDDQQLVARWDRLSALTAQGIKSLSPDERQLACNLIEVVERDLASLRKGVR